MRPTWLLEADVFGTATESLKAALRRQGMAWHVVRHPPAGTGPRELVPGRGLDGAECVVLRGSWPLMRHIQLHCPAWVPAGWCDAGKLDCASYYPHFGSHLLNRRHVILTGVEAIARREELFTDFARDGEVFVRPTGMQKLFTGRCVTGDEFAAALAPARYDPATRVVVAEPKEVACEWRLVVAGNVVVTASRYYKEGELDVAAGCPAAVRTFAEHVLREVAWRPDELFMLDVCESAGELFVLELNSFSCSGLYACDLGAVVGTAGEWAAKAWERRFANPAT